MAVEIITPLSACKFISENTPDEVKQIINELLAKGMNKWMTRSEISEREFHDRVVNALGYEEYQRYNKLMPLLEEAGWDVTYHDDDSFGRYVVTAKK